MCTHDWASNWPTAQQPLDPVGSGAAQRARTSRGRRRAGATGGIQPGDLARRNWRGQLEAGRGGGVGHGGTHRGGGVTMGRRGQLWTAVFRWRGGSDGVRGGGESCGKRQRGGCQWRGRSGKEAGCGKNDGAAPF
jgi:hypothetical protein